MATDFLERCNIIEECYEFLLSYAGKGLHSDSGSEVRRLLERAAAAIEGIKTSCAESFLEQRDETTRQQRFLAVLERDAGDSLAAIELVLAQPAISSQLVDNLNASIHLRALLTDLFLAGEIVRAQRRPVPTSG